MGLEQGFFTRRHPGAVPQGLSLPSVCVRSEDTLEVHHRVWPCLQSVLEGSLVSYHKYVAIWL